LALEGDAQDSSACVQDARRHLARAPRRDRQHVEILAAVLEDHLTQALGLAFEHLTEFGPDPLMVSVLTQRIERSPDPGLSDGLQALLDQTRTAKERAGG
jgi:hypothetical protein